MSTDINSTDAWYSPVWFVYAHGVPWTVDSEQFSFMREPLKFPPPRAIAGVPLRLLAFGEREIS